MTRTFSAALMLSLASLALGGCGSTDSSPDAGGVSNSPLVGTWLFFSNYLPGCPKLYQIYTFKGDATFELDVLQWAMPADGADANIGTYAIEGNELVLLSLEASCRAEWKAANDPRRWPFTLDASGDTVTFAHKSGVVTMTRAGKAMDGCPVDIPSSFQYGCSEPSTGAFYASGFSKAW